MDIVLGILGFVFGGGFLLWLGKTIFRTGEFKNRFDNLEESFEKLESKFDDFAKKMSNWAQVVELRLQRHDVAIGISPIKLRDKFRPFIKETNIDKQVKSKGVTLCVPLLQND